MKELSLIELMQADKYTLEFCIELRAIAARKTGQDKNIIIEKLNQFQDYNMAIQVEIMHRLDEVTKSKPNYFQQLINKIKNKWQN